MNRVQGFLALLLKKQKQWKYKHEKVFFQLKVRRSIKIWNEMRLFLETGKGLTFAGFTESVDLRLDWWIWHYIMESSAELLPGAKKDGFCLSTSQSLWRAKWSGVL